MVTGAAGMLGHVVVEVARAGGHDVHALARAELDIADEPAVLDALERISPETLINCAAWTDVDGAEADFGGAERVNGLGAGNLARAAASAGVHMLHVSTDYVFAGDGTRPYLESDPVDPRSAYGRSKLAGERAVLEASPAHCVARAAWLFGAGGPNFVDTMLRLAGDGREAVGVVTDQVGCPTWTGHLAPALLTLSERGTAGIRHVPSSGSCTWNELAREVFAQAGVDCRVLPATSAEMARPAPRPAYSVLGSAHSDRVVLPPWQEGVRGHLRHRGAGAGLPKRGAGAVGAGAREESAS